ncbi:ROK family protein [Vibrio sinensis]|uniref:ROK family protein n=1 Tax=Vibrio sinensis TaxID=2302434 RepID=A0A3A6R8N5_9VIBR|nr:ROK family protein [Vibrio sinensis]RJX72881.1 ROK family protein [Vibrio sinensis]
MKNHFWGVDLGGTKIECAVIDDQMNVLVRERVATEREKGYEHILQRIKLVVEMCADKMGYFPKLIGFGTPGSLDPQTGVMKNCNSTQLNDKPLKTDLEQSLNINAILTNDANCLALSESVMGAVANLGYTPEVVFAVIMGTGCGAGIVINGKVINGHHGIAGEWGHNVLEENGIPCYCGKRGCVETIISGTGVERYHNETHGQSLSLKEIVTLARNGNEQSKNSLNHLIDSFAKAISPIINIIDPDVIIIGGGVGNIDELYELSAKKIEKQIFNHQFNAKIIKPELGDSSGVFGAALLCK